MGTSVASRAKILLKLEKLIRCVKINGEIKINFIHNSKKFIKNSGCEKFANKWKFLFFGFLKRLAK